MLPFLADCDFLVEPDFPALILQQLPNGMGYRSVGARIADEDVRLELLVTRFRSMPHD